MSIRVTGLRPAYSRPASVRFAGQHEDNFRKSVASDFTYRAWENARGTGFSKTLADQLASVRVAQELVNPKYRERFPGDTREAIADRARERHYSLVGYYKRVLSVQGLGNLTSFEAQDLEQEDQWRQKIEGALAPLGEPPFGRDALN